jgi:hypothetical protein
MMGAFGWQRADGSIRWRKALDAIKESVATMREADALQIVGAPDRPQQAEA